MAERIIGREAQIEQLKKYVNSDRSEFIAVYGRRRVGKTFLIRNAFAGKFSFSVTGIHNASKAEQLVNFAVALQKYSGTEQIQIDKSWVLAFHRLATYLETLRKGPKVVFIDELPWMETHKSGFVNALENFWNGWASARGDIKLIVCGSATSWIISNIIRSRGGLHNRVTHKMLVEPFHLKECEEYFKAYKFDMTKDHIAECYMVMGGVPYYMSLMDRGLSLAENIDMLFFQKNAELENEFNELYNSLFRNPAPYISIIEALASKGTGFTRKELIEKTALADNGGFSMMLEELELCGFIRSYLPYENFRGYRDQGKRIKRNTLYQLIDFYTIFYYAFLKGKRFRDSKFWESSYNEPVLNIWRGIAFEKLCLYHEREVKRALGIEGIQSNVCSWLSKDSQPKVQIDMIIDRKDNALNLCEMKYTAKDFVIDKKYYENLTNKLETFREESMTRKSIIMTMITNHGVAHNRYREIVRRQVLLKDLF